MTSKIEWTEETWNPTVGCSRVSPGCGTPDGGNCYAIGVAHRAMTPAHQGVTVRLPGEKPDWTGEVRLLPERLEQPLRWQRPRLIFVDSMSDLFHEKVPPGFIARAFGVMALTRRHTYQVLTKRPQRAKNLLSGSFAGEVAEELSDVIGRTPSSRRRQLEIGPDWRATPSEHGNVWHPPWPLPNVWLGTSIELDRYAWRADHLRATPATVRFLSLEPLLGPLPSLNLTGIDWVIVGGQSGPGARPMHPDWVRQVRDSCVDAGVPFFFKQWGEHRPMLDYLKAGGGCPVPCVEVPTGGGGRYGEMVRVGKKLAGRELDGRTWDEMPAVSR